MLLYFMLRDVAEKIWKLLKEIFKHRYNSTNDINYFRTERFYKIISSGSADGWSIYNFHFSEVKKKNAVHWDIQQYKQTYTRCFIKKTKRYHFYRTLNNTGNQSYKNNYSNKHN